MNATAQTFIAVGDDLLAKMIQGASRRVVYAAPGLGMLTASALVNLMRDKTRTVQVTIILEADADAYRIGYGDHEALQALHDGAVHAPYPVRRQHGLRLGVLIADHELVIWSPIARAVEADRKPDEPNGVVLRGAVTQSIEAAVGADGSDVLLENAEIGRHALEPEQIKAMVDDLVKNPPAPFDLSRRARVFSTRFQFVEFEVRGAEWTERKISLSSLLLNVDLPEALQDIIDTQVRPFQAKADATFDVPLVVHGQRAFHKDGTRIMVSATQAEILKGWSEIRDRYLRNIKGFGWLVRRDRLSLFQSEVEAFEEMLKAWVTKFREHVRIDEEQMVNSIVGAIESRLARANSAQAKEKAGKMDLSTSVRDGLRRLRTIDPGIRVVVKDISWIGSRDAEFIGALQKVLPASELEGWFEEFTAAMPATPVGSKA